MRQHRPPRANATGSARLTENGARGTGKARHLRAYAGLALLGLALAGCQENGYRTEVKGNGQGGVEVKRVPKEPEAPTDQAGAPAPTSAPSSRPTSADEQLRAKVEEMQAQIDRQNQEIQRLKQPATAPTTQP